MALKTNAVLSLGIAALVGAGLGVKVAIALEDTATMAVTTSIAQSCTLNNVIDLSFPAYVPSGGTKDGQTTFDLDCSVAGTVQVDISNGFNHNGSFRGMAGPGRLDYRLYSDAGHNDAWLAPKPVTINTGGLTETVGVFGVIFDNPTNQAQPAGSYSDQVTITATF